MATPTFDFMEDDFFLQSLVKFINGSESNELSLTVFTGGLIATGTLISERAYFSKTSEAFDASFMDQLFSEGIIPGDDLMGIVSGIGESYRKATEGSMPTYLHMREVLFFMPGSEGELSIGESLWRAKVRAIDGFLLGRINLD